jgi:outer membrane protein assembly factor BamB
MYHRDLARTGYVADAHDPRQLIQAWNASLDGGVYAEPLVVNGHVIVATEVDTLYSLDAHTGNVQWRTNVGSPIPLSQLPCGNIDPLGITGTPVYDPASGLVFAVAEVTGPAHLLVGIDAATGQVRVRRSADPAGLSPVKVHQQRAALALSQGMVYIAYGGLAGDCGFYNGWVVASRTDGQGPLLSYELPTLRGGIWAPSGPAVDGTGRVYISVGNGQSTRGEWDHSDSVLRLSPALQLEDGFAPDQWAADNANDADLGSMGPVLLPGGLVYADGKSGIGYLLHADALGGIGGQALKSTVFCHAYGGAATVGSTIFLPCTEGLQQLIVGPGIRLTTGWHAPVNVAGSPIVGGHTVYSLSMDEGVLYALNSETGTVRARVSVGGVTRFATPTLSQGVVYVGTVDGVVAVKIQ